MGHRNAVTVDTVCADWSRTDVRNAARRSWAKTITRDQAIVRLCGIPHTECAECDQAVWRPAQIRTWSTTEVQLFSYRRACRVRGAPAGLVVLNAPERAGRRIGRDAAKRCVVVLPFCRTFGTWVLKGRRVPRTEQHFARSIGTARASRCRENVCAEVRAPRMRVGTRLA